MIRLWVPNCSRYADGGVDKIIEEFNGLIDIECKESRPDTDYVVSLANQYYVKAQNALILKDRIKILSSIIIRLDKAISLDGFGKDMDEAMLIEEAMDDAAKIMERLLLEHVDIMK